MAVLKFQGKVEFVDYNPERILIGGRDVIDELDWGEAFKGKPVTVAFADERFTGDLDVEPGIEGYSEWTPGDPTTFDIGGHNLIELLERYDGQELTLWIADEPINTLE